MMENVGDKLTSRTQNNFNLIRLLAASAVIITHSYSLLGLPENDILTRASHGVLSFSRLGVYVFFIISGFLITQSLERSRSLLSFFWKRCLRIFPALAVVLVLSVFILGPLITTAGVKEYFSSYSTWRYLGGITLYRITYMLPGVFGDNFYRNAVNGSIWTLPYEWTCYLVLAGLLFWLKKKSWAVVSLALVIAVLLHQFGGKNFLNATIPVLLLNVGQFLNYLIFFLVGAGAYIFRQYLSFSKISLSIALGLLVAAFYLLHSINILYFVLTYLILWLAVLPLPGRKYWLERDYSYGLYIYAFPVQQIVAHYWGAFLGVAGFAVMAWLATMPLAILSWHWVERPALRLKSRLFL
jgi:peptidoglycan/LPS O-acetylase OafA/YrhL